MANDADQVIKALHAGADDLDPLVRRFTPEQLTGPSAAAEWNVSQVLSHLGSGAVITLATLDAALAGRPNPGNDANRAVWARWDAMGPAERAEGYLAANADLLARYDGLDSATRDSLRIDLGFLPEPVDLASAARMRLNEYTLHSWDVRVVLDPAATLRPEAPPLLLDLVAFMLGWLATPAALGGRAVALRIELSDLDRAFGLAIDDGSASLGDVPAQPDGVVQLPAEAWLRLVSGRLAPAHTPASVTVSGDVPLETLRQVFRGF